ncbi:hypothetical protein B566_EDAN018574 [Ephemera danica]|nr:hypothetical protein B566_EDAN018574 [Ephemera danica]
MQEIIFSPAKSGKATYQCARSSEWGDVLPIDIEESLVSTNSAVESEESASDDEARK